MNKNRIITFEFPHFEHLTKAIVAFGFDFEAEIIIPGNYSSFM